MMAMSKVFFKFSIIFFVFLLISPLILSQIDGVSNFSEENFFDLKEASSLFLGKEISSGTNSLYERDTLNISTRFLIFFILFLLVFSLLDSTNLFESNIKKFVLFLLAFFLSFISFRGISNLELLTLTQIYSSFGGALVTLIPFLVLGGFTIRAVIDGNPKILFIQRIIWFLFFVFIYYILTVQTGKFFFWIGEFWNLDNLSGAKGILLLTLVFSFLLFIFNGFLINYLNKSVLRAEISLVDNNLNDIRQGVNTFRRVGRSR